MSFYLRVTSLEVPLLDIINANDSVGVCALSIGAMLVVLVFQCVFCVLQVQLVLAHDRAAKAA